MVRLESVSISYRIGGQELPAVQDAVAEFPSGSITAVIGPSGCGKTSLIQAMAGLIRPSAGRVLIQGSELRAVRRQTAVIFQDYGLLPWKTARDNAELPLLLAGMGARERHARVDPILEELGLAEFSRFFPARLSGGMRQRLAVARALASGPDLLLMDEPFSSLDALTRESLQETLLAVQARHGTTVVLVTHSIEEAAYLGDSVIVMRGRNPGRIELRLASPRNSDKGPSGPVGSPGGRGADSGAFRASAAFLRLATEVRAALAGQGEEEKLEGGPA
ncbi:MAG TPA: ABC transporter ATP-binding protein [Rectinemataceae bacterium]|nr:ABC transporter ATP-binding protein [Rectinemataceae bacterium]